MSEPDEVVLSFHDSLLRRSDVALLDHNQWLNDEIITFIYEYFEKYQFKDVTDLVVFTHPGTVQLTKFLQGPDLLNCLDGIGFDDKRLLFLPINDNDSTKAGGTHWSLLVYDRATNMFHHYDSFRECNSITARQVARNIEPCLKASDPCGFREELSPQQVNGCDCGLYVICTTEYLVRRHIQGHNICMTDYVNPTTVNQRRTQIKELIYELAKNS